MTFLRSTILIAAVLLLPRLLCGQPPPSKDLTLDECIAIAKERNAALRIAKTGTRIADLAQDEFRTAGLPQVNLRSGASYAPSNRSFGYDPVVSNQGELSAQVEVEQTLYDGGARSLRSDQLRMEIEKARLGERIAERDIVYAVKAAFIERLRASRFASAVAQSVRQLEEYLTIVERRVAAGAGTQSDLLKTRIQLENARIGMGRSAVAVNTATMLLNELMGRDPKEELGIAGTLDSIAGVTAESFSRAPRPPVDSSFESRQASIGIRQSALEAEIAGHERYPRFSLVGDAGVLTSVENLRLPKEDRYGILGYQVGIAVAMPLFNWGATGLRQEERQLVADTLQFQRELLQRALRREIEQTLDEALQAERTLAVLRKNVASAEDNFLITQSAYAGGGSSSLEVLSAQQLLTETETAETETAAALQLLLSRLQQLSTQ